MSTPVRPGANNIPKARYFLDRVREEEEREPWNLLALGSNLESAIIFAKTLQDVLADEAGCAEERAKKRWMKRVGLWGDPVCKFLVEQRDLVVHRDGTVSMVPGKSVYLYAMPARSYASAGRATLTASPDNPNPVQRVWLRRREKQDRRDKARLDKIDRIKLHRRMREDRERDLAQMQAMMAMGDPPPWARFDHEDPAIGYKRATEVVEEYIAKLEAILAQPVSYETTT